MAADTCENWCSLFPRLHLFRLLSLSSSLCYKLGHGELNQRCFEDGMKGGWGENVCGQTMPQTGRNRIGRIVRKAVRKSRSSMQPIRTWIRQTPPQARVWTAMANTENRRPCQVVVGQRAAGIGRIAAGIVRQE